MKLERNRMVEVLFYTAAFTKQFYLLPSGSIGIADLFFALSGVLTFSLARRSGKKICYQEDFPWVVFLIFAAVINGIYFVRTPTWSVVTILAVRRFGNPCMKFLEWTKNKEVLMRDAQVVRRQNGLAIQYQYDVDGRIARKTSSRGETHHRRLAS